MLEQTSHQERSREAFDNQNTQEQLIHQRNLVDKIHAIVYKKMIMLTQRNIESYLKAKAQGGGTICKTTHYDN